MQITRPDARVVPPQEGLRAAARALETQFLAEMLKAAAPEARHGLGSGGVGETQFASFLREARAERMVEAGGIGLAEAIFRHLAARHGG